MPGINQLGGALTATATPTPSTGAEGNASNQGPQADAGLQVAPNDGVKGAAEAKRADNQTDENSARARREERQFAALARSKNARVDGKTGDVVQVDGEETEDVARRAAGETKESPESKERLKRALTDLFAVRPRPQNGNGAEAKAKEAE